MIDQLGRAHTRCQEHEITIDSPIEAVWAALTNAAELECWLVDHKADIEPRVGGKVWLSWGHRRHQESHIEVWLPGRCLRLRLLSFNGSYGLYNAREPITEEYELKSHGGKTVVHLLHSGIPTGLEWDDYYKRTNRGWMIYLRWLRHYLQEHRGKRRRLTRLLKRLPGSIDQAWANLTGTDGLRYEPNAGGEFSLRTLSGSMLSGQLLFVKAPEELDLTIRQLNNALFTQSMEYSGAAGYVHAVLAVYESPTDRVLSLEGEWVRWLVDVLTRDGGCPTPARL